MKSIFRTNVRALGFLLLMLVAQCAFAQQKTVTGKVTDNKQEPLIGVNVVVKGNASSGAITDINGKYSVTVTGRDATLVFSYVGYQTQEVAVGQRSVVNVVLEDDAEALEEVVVVGYGTMKKSDLTGSVSSLSSDHFKIGSDLSPQQLMQGAFSGVNVNMNSGKPGGMSTIRIRGGTSVTASNDPLYVIDGMPIDANAGISSAVIGGTGTSATDHFDSEAVNPLASIDPNDIESINILKDASASAIYGSRGANGVIIITTKKGKQGVNQLDYNFSIGFSSAAKQLDMLTANEYRDAVEKYDLTLDDGGDNANWQDRVQRTAISQNHHISFSSGFGNTNYRASINYSKQEGILKGSEQTSANARINVNHSALNDKLKFNLNLSYGQTDADQAPIANTGGSESGTNMLYESYVFNPTYPVYDEDGDYMDSPPYRVNPLSYVEEVLDERKSKKFIGNLTADWNFYKWFTFQVNVGYTNNSLDRNSYISKSNLLGNSSGGYVNIQKLSDYSKLLETILKFDYTIGKHTVNAMAGYSYQYFYSDSFNAAAYGFLSDSFKWYSIQAAQTVESVTTSAASNKLISMYARVNYNYADKYLVTATVRRDGSSRFGEDHKWGWFPSVAASWRISQEDFYNSSILTDLKLRVSWGVTGNQEIGNYNSLNLLSAYSSYYLIGGERQTIVLPSTYSNPDIKWEETSQTNIGLDFSFWHGKIHGSFDYYYKKTNDLLLTVAVPSPSLITSQTANVGSVKNQGIELELGFDLYRNKDWAWDLSLNLAHNKNELTSLSNSKWTGEDMQTSSCQGTGLEGDYAQLVTPGQPLGTFYGKKFTGMSSDGEEEFADDGADQIIGCAQPDLTFGLVTTLQYKKWSLSLNFRGSIGNDVYNNTANDLAYLTSLPGRNVLKSALDSGISRTAPKAYSSRFIEDGSFLRLDNITIGYDFSYKPLRLTHARVFLTAQNLFCITGYDGLDPEVNSEVSRSGVAPLGIDYMSYPKARTFTLGINLSF